MGMKFDVDNLQSTIPKLLGLPPPIDLETKKEIENIAEGIVIRKLTGKDHVLLKIKAKKFLEIACPWKAKDQNKKKKNQRNAGNIDGKLAKIKELILKFQDEEFCDFI